MANAEIMIDQPLDEREQDAKLAILLSKLLQ